MKKIVVAMAMLMAAGGASAANSHQAGSFALGFDAVGSSLGNVIIDNMITGKYMIANDLALTAGAGFTSVSDGGGDALAFSVGVRKYLSADDFSPFFGGSFSYENQDLNGDTTTTTFAGEFGAEYFLAQRFSVEGTAGLGFMLVDDNTTDTTTNFLSTFRSGVGFNFYF